MLRTVIKFQTICLIAGFLGLISVVLGYAAERTNIKVSQVHQVSPGVCSYPRSPAYGLGITSAIALLLAHFIINVICCVTRDSYTSTTHLILALVCFVESWLTFIVAFLLLFGGAILNNRHGVVKVEYLGHKSCQLLSPGVFAVASLLSSASVTFSILYFFITAHAEAVGSPALPIEGGVAIVQAQVLQISHDPPVSVQIHM